MKIVEKILNYLLVVAVVVGVLYACAEDYFTPYEKTMAFNTNDPRELMIVTRDSMTLSAESGVEKLVSGESSGSSSGGNMVKIATFRSYKGGGIGLYTIVDYDFKEIEGSRCITRAGATMTYTQGEVPAGSRFFCHNSEPRVTFSGDKIYLEVEVILDYGDFFVEGDDNYETRCYHKEFDPFSNVSIVD